VLQAQVGDASRATHFELPEGAVGVARELGGWPLSPRLSLFLKLNFPFSRGCWDFDGIKGVPFLRET
jgi:hypothetical protein